MNITKTHHIPFSLKYYNLLSNGVYVIDDIQPSWTNRSLIFFLNIVHVQS